VDLASARTERAVVIAVVGILVSACLLPSVALAQCAMCKAALEGSTDGLGAQFNRAILVMLAGPYLVMGVFGVVLFRERLGRATGRMLARLRRITSPRRTG
jgi:hypothetical protein